MIDIDHNPHERRPTNTVYWVLATGLVFSWIGYFWFREGADWWSICLGGFTALVITIWAIDKFEHPSSKP